jgi:hypothetical protein
MNLRSDEPKELREHSILKNIRDVLARTRRPNEKEIIFWLTDKIMAIVTNNAADLAVLTKNLADIEIVHKESPQYKRILEMHELCIDIVTLIDALQFKWKDEDERTTNDNSNRSGTDSISEQEARESSVPF